MEQQTQQKDQEAHKQKMVKQLSMSVCICKGIPLSKFLPCLGDVKTSDEMHERVGSGQGGCAGRRCTPRVQKLIKKYQREVLNKYAKERQDPRQNDSGPVAKKEEKKEKEGA